MSSNGAVDPATADDDLESAPCGYVVTDADGCIQQVNRTFESWTGFTRETLVGNRTFSQLLNVGGRIYHETHFSPLLRMQGTVEEIALEIVKADGERLPVLVNATLDRNEAGAPHRARIMVFASTERRRYEEELLRARRWEHDIAEELQASLLAGALPVAPGLELAVAYRPAVVGLKVGGDWYDAFWVRDGAVVAFVVGDVVGRGLEAASTMGQLRSAVRALAGTGLEPGEVLAALDGYAGRHGVGRMATLIYAEVDLTASRMRFACAGHPPPAVLVEGRAPGYAWEGRSLPLDSGLVDGALRPTGTVDVPPGTTLLLYSDGLIERRGEVLDRGLARLAQAADARRGLPMADLADRLAQELADPEHADDVCLLAARIR